MDLDMNEKETAARFSFISFFHFCLCILCVSSSLWSVLADKRKTNKQNVEGSMYVKHNYV